MKQLIRKIVNKLGYDIHRLEKEKTDFIIGDIHFMVNPCSVKETPQGERTAEGAIRLIRERKLQDLKILDMCCGAGIIGLTMFSRLHKEGAVSTAALSDINIFNLNAVHKTLAANTLPLDRIATHLSNALTHLPPTEKFDLIVSNPPHYFDPTFSDKAPLTPGRLGTFDQGWKFHKDFYDKCHEHLTPNGEVWFLENGKGAQPEDLKPFIEANPKLELREIIEEPLIDDFFWMITGLKGSQ